MSDDPAAPAAPAPVVPEPEQGPETVTLTKAEVDALRRQVAEASKAQRKLEADQKKADEERQAEQGQYKEIADQKDRELQQERAERTRVEREQRIARVAGRMRFLDPDDVKGRISQDDGEDEQLVETALKRIAERSPHLVAKEEQGRPEIGQVLSPAAGVPDGAPKPPAGKSPLTSEDDVRRLNETEINERWDEVAAVMSRPG